MRGDRVVHARIGSAAEFDGHRFLPEQRVDAGIDAFDLVEHGQQQFVDRVHVAPHERLTGRTGHHAWISAEIVQFAGQRDGSEERGRRDAVARGRMADVVGLACSQRAVDEYMAHRGSPLRFWYGRASRRRRALRRTECAQLHTKFIRAGHYQLKNRRMRLRGAFYNNGIAAAPTESSMNPPAQADASNPYDVIDIPPELHRPACT
jgi:hypothetical protein